MYICQWPVFHGPVILPYILKNICWTNAIIGILVPCDAIFASLNVCGSVTYISWSSDFVLYLEDYLMDGCCTGDIDSVWHKHWTETIYVSQWPIFHAPVILPYILTIWWTNVIMEYWIHVKQRFTSKCMLVSDLYFMVQWFCLISWSLFDGLMLFWSYWFNVTQILNWNYICRPVTYVSCSSDFALYLEDYLMDKCHSWNIGSMWCKD